MRKRKYSEHRSPTLNTVLMIEETLSRAGKVLTIGKLKSGKIVVHDYKVLWTFKPQSKPKKMQKLIVK